MLTYICRSLVYLMTNPNCAIIAKSKLETEDFAFSSPFKLEMGLRFGRFPSA